LEIEGNIKIRTNINEREYGKTIEKTKLRFGFGKKINLIGKTLVRQEKNRKFKSSQK
jgi:hypothetical protein